MTFENIKTNKNFEIVSKILEYCQKHEDPPKDMYEEVDDSGRGKRGMQTS